MTTSVAGAAAESSRAALLRPVAWRRLVAWRRPVAVGCRAAAWVALGGGSARAVAQAGAMARAWAGAMARVSAFGEPSRAVSPAVGELVRLQTFLVRAQAPVARRLPGRAEPVPAPAPPGDSAQAVPAPPSRAWSAGCPARRPGSDVRVVFRARRSGSGASGMRGVSRARRSESGAGRTAPGPVPGSGPTGCPGRPTGRRPASCPSRPPRRRPDPRDASSCRLRAPPRRRSSGPEPVLSPTCRPRRNRRRPRRGSGRAFRRSPPVAPLRYRPPG
ncbi:MAG: hypothetical protein QOE51_2149 [Actinoplanes sp.]|nr:hypothetical protein [Actinoplanes sp.]